MSEAILRARAVVDVSVEQAREWFLSLKAHPERYQFDTHDGFTFVEGSFGEVGAHFTTRERFFFLALELPFELTEVGESGFGFRLTRAGCLRVWGRYDIDRAGEGGTALSLVVGSETRVGRVALRAFPVAAAVQRQIQREVDHVKASMERMPS